MAPGPTSQVHHRARDILGLAQPTIGRLILQRLHPTLLLNQPTRHLGREEPRRDSISEHPARTQLQRQILRQMDHSRFRSRVTKRSILTQRTHTQPSHGARNNHPRRVRRRRLGRKKRRKLLHEVENTLNVQIHDFRKCALGVRLELLAPGRARVGEQDVHVVRRLLDLGDETVELIHARVVRGHGDGLRVGAFGGEGVEGFHGFFAGGGFAGGDVDFGAAGLEEAVSLLVMFSN